MKHFKTFILSRQGSEKEKIRYPKAAKLRSPSAKIYFIEAIIFLRNKL
jgi:hypothetical protein